MLQTQNGQSNLNQSQKYPYHFLAHFWPQNHHSSSYYCYLGQWSHAGSDNYSEEFAWSCCFLCLLMYISSCLYSLSLSSTLTYSCLYSHFCCSGYKPINQTSTSVPLQRRIFWDLDRVTVN